jgi:hypothetical protein
MPRAPVLASQRSRSLETEVVVARSSFERCLQQMWDEGPPPAPLTIDQCIMDRAQGGCFLSHGHYINMIQTMYKSVSCGFYEKADGSYWANQDFPIKR